MGGISMDIELCRALDDMTQFIKRLAEKNTLNTRQGADVQESSVHPPAAAPSLPAAQADGGAATGLLGMADITPYEQDRLNNIERNKRKMQEIFGSDTVQLFKQRKTRKAIILCNADLKNGQTCQRPKMKGNERCHWHNKPLAQQPTETSRDIESEFEQVFAEFEGDLDKELEKEVDDILGNELTLCAAVGI